MKICNILPLSYNELMYKEEMVMLLAHLSVNNEFYSINAKNHSNYKIMDNSIIELGKAFSLKSLIKEAIKCEANEIILPDSFRDGEKTIKLVNKSVKYLKKKHLIGKFKLMAVCQGKTFEEFENTFKILNDIKEIDVIGIPKVTTKDFKSRMNLYNIFSKTSKQIHLLGCWDSFEELKLLNKEQLSKIRSMDTCLLSLLSKNLEVKSVFDKKRPVESINFYTSTINIDKYYKLRKELYNYLKEEK